jgi:hypothetical protein
VIVERPQVVDVVVEVVDVDAIAFRFAMAPMVQRVDCIPSWHELIDDVAIAAAVLPVAVSDQQHGPGIAVWQPALMEYRQAAFALERAL